MKKSLFTCVFISFLGQFSAQSNTSHTIQHNGITREYKLYVPAIYDGTTAVPLVFNLHGYTSNNVQQESYGNFRPIADTANFIIIHPNGTFDGGGNRYWNAFGYPGVDDVGFLSLLIDEINADYNIDLNRVYSTGMSNGGYMSYELACTIGHRITAVASVTGTMTSAKLAACNPANPTPIMQIHGTADGVVPYNGDVSNTPIPDLVDFWVQLNGCNTTPVITPVPNTNTTDGCTAEHYIYENGNAGSTVEFYKITDGGHTWPGAPVIIGVTNRDFDASIEIWRFFSQYRLNELVSVSEMAMDSPKVYPNPTTGKVTVNFDKKMDEITVFDVAGRTVVSYDNLSTTAEITIQHSGIYYIHILSNGMTSMSKVVVE